jgi:myo-inositol-1-phosphate synthase
VLPICAYAFKHPPQHMPVEAAERMFANYIAEES